MAKRKGKVAQQCGCRVRVKQTKRGKRHVVTCPGTPMQKFMSEEEAKARRGQEFCTTMPQPFKKQK
jgi:hypothetical protein